jgi:hypothetical protein
MGAPQKQFYSKSEAEVWVAFDCRGPGMKTRLRLERRAWGSHATVESLGYGRVVLEVRPGRLEGARRMLPVDVVLGRADNARKVGDGWLMSCPRPDHGQGRGDRNPCVSVTDGDEGRGYLTARLDVRRRISLRPGVSKCATSSSNVTDTKRVPFYSPKTSVTNKEVSDVEHINEGSSRVSHHRLRKES